jgi:hypothetical protein
MNAFQTLIVIFELLVLIPLSIVAVSIGILGIRIWSVHSSTGDQTAYVLSLVVGLLLAIIAARILLTAPYFDFVDRCRPFGTALCIDGRSPVIVRRELLLDQARAILICIISPVLGAAILVQLYTFFRSRMQNRAS